MGLNAFLGIPGVKGSAKQKHVEGKIVVHAVSGEALAELNWKSGRPEKEKFKYKPLVVTKPIDVSSPALHTALHYGTEWDVVELEFWRMPPAGGPEEKYFKIGMFEVCVMSIKTLLYNNRKPENVLLPEFEEVTFVFNGIGYSYDSKDGTSTSGGNSKSKKLKAKFDIPAEAKAKAIAIDLGKDAGKVLAGDVWKLLKGESTDEPEEAK